MSEQSADQRHEEQLRGGATTAGVGAYLLHRAKPHLPPWLGVVGLGIAGTAANLAWEDSVGAGVGLTLSSVALTAATWWAGRSTSAQRRLHSAVTVAAGSAWLTGAALCGPLSGPLPDLYAMGGAVAALSWNVRMVMRRNPDATGEGSGDKGLLEKVGLARTRLGTPKIEPNKLTVPYALPAGEATNDDVSRALPRIASALDVPTTAVRFRPDPDSARKGELVVVPEDMLREVIWYPGPSAPGGSIAEPLVIGVYDDGQELRLTLPQAIHLLVMGVTGSGKTEAALDVMAEVLTRRDVAVWLSDPKRGQDLGEAFDACDWVVTTQDGAALMIAAFEAVVPARQLWLGSHGYRSWEPAAASRQADPAHTCREDGTACGCPGMPYLIGWFEEAANTLRAVDDDAFTGIAQEARSAGASLVLSMQRASGYQISTDTRASLPSALCMGVDERDAAFALPSDVLEAGANPGAWGNKRPGYCYLVSAGIEEGLWSTPSRTFRNNPVTLEWVAREFAPVRMPMDAVTAEAAATVAGQVYTDRKGPQGSGGPAVEDDDVRTGEPMVDPEDAGIDPSVELPEADDADHAPMFAAVAGTTPDDPKAAMEEILRAFEAEGRMVVQTKDFMDYCDRIGRSRPWVAAELGRLGREGRLVPASGHKYRIIPTLTPA
ncbi:plasmid transfer protein TraB [Streptomyces sp. SHP 1-2]|uniref:plasmid transfer protein TraB n=1 Tax=Streptomyces sp. SHP 1-2 TaxID=2769489 RepID=UPI00223749D4|nr:plasmid transfer protein TraB [Streptomyces sp. SHP 1-2]MCW5254721.1 sporulation protein SsgA [Streptomyces sp. SHP 1-2]